MRPTRGMPISFISFLQPHVRCKQTKVGIVWQELDKTRQKQRIRAETRRILTNDLSHKPRDFRQKQARIAMTQDDGKGGLSLRGLAFKTVLAVLESTLPSFCLLYKIQYQEATVTGLTVLAVSAVMAVSVLTATPLQLNLPFPSS